MGNQHEDEKGVRGASAAHRRYVKWGDALDRMDYLHERLAGDFLEIVSITVRFPRAEGDDFLVVTRAFTEEGPKVGFHNADSFAEAVVGTINRLRNSSMKWKDDQYAK